jgi:uncharacterized protein YnzC (UPF0291/DUF896 family)
MSRFGQWVGIDGSHPCDLCEYNGRYCAWPDVDPAVAEAGDCPILSVLNASPSQLAEDEDLNALREIYLDEFGVKVTAEAVDHTAWILDVSQRVSVHEPQVDIEGEAKRLVQGLNLDDISTAQDTIRAATAYIRTNKSAAARKEEFLAAVEKERRSQFNRFYSSGNMVDLPNESLFS